MRQVKTVKTLVKQLNKAFPGLEAVDYSEWDGQEKEAGVWLKGMAGLDSTRWSPWGSIECIEPSPMGEFLEARGWFLEPYDSHTVMAWRV